MSLDLRCFALLLVSGLVAGCQRSPRLVDSPECPVAWGLECRAAPYHDGQLWYFNCTEGSRHAETVDAVDLHDGEGFQPWCRAKETP